MAEFWPSLEAWAERVEQLAAAGLVDGMAIAEAEGKATDAYVGVTGATRASTTGYVPGTNDEHASGGVQAVVEHNPLHLDVQDAGAPPDGVLRGVLTAFTDYQIKLERDNAGQRSWIPDAIYGTSARVMQAIVNRVREAF